MSGGDVIRGASATTVRRITVLIAKTRHRCVPFFNEPNDVRISLRIQMNHPVQRRPARWCALCGTFRNSATGHRTTHYCSFCTVHLYIKAMSGEMQSCWLVWHSNETITPPVPVPDLCQVIICTGTAEGREGNSEDALGTNDIHGSEREERSAPRRH